VCLHLAPWLLQLWNFSGGTAAAGGHGTLNQACRSNDVACQKTPPCLVATQVRGHRCRAASDLPSVPRSGCLADTWCWP
jgi:hypothetical protein